jgi:hypothetical protein
MYRLTKSRIAALKEKAYKRLLSMSDERKNCEINAAKKGEIVLSIDGRDVRVEEYESVSEGEVASVCCGDHELGVAAEHAWFQHRFPGAELEYQELSCITLNSRYVQCDILTIKLCGGQTKKIYFDISRFCEK